MAVLVSGYISQRSLVSLVASSPGWERLECGHCVKRSQVHPQGPKKVFIDHLCKAC